MVCPYCQQKTVVVNSRSQYRRLSVWRRRRCRDCAAVFTTIERPRLESVVMIVSDSNQLKALTETGLIASISRAFDQTRVDPVLIESIYRNCLVKILALGQAKINQSQLERIIYQTIKPHDDKAAWRYLAGADVSLPVSQADL